MLIMCSIFLLYLNLDLPLHICTLKYAKLRYALEGQHFKLNNQSIFSRASFLIWKLRIFVTISSWLLHAFKFKHFEKNLFSALGKNMWFLGIRKILYVEICLKKLLILHFGISICQHVESQWFCNKKSWPKMSDTSISSSLSLSLRMI